MSGRETQLAALFATLLPGDGHYPPAGQLPMADRLAAYPHFHPAAEAMLAHVPADFATLAEAAREDALRGIEADEPGVFRDFVTAAYSLYYSDEAVLAAIARTANYAPRAPQPEGYPLPPFDPRSVAVPAARAPLYRPVEPPHD